MPLPLFGKSHKSPPDIVKNLKDALLLIEKGDKKSEKAVEEVSRWLQAIKAIIYGQEGQEPQTEQVSLMSILSSHSRALCCRSRNWRRRRTMRISCRC
jgi:calcium binding protein 39